VPTVENGLWIVSPDGRMQTTWRIRPGARWHDGTPLTSADLLFTIAVEQDKEVGIPRHPAVELIESVEGPDPNTVTVKWKQPYIEADMFFTGEVALPMPQHLLDKAFAEDKANFGAVPYWTQEFVGTGPFKMREWALDSYVVVVANEAYVLGRPKVDEIEVRYIADQSTLIANLMAGSVEVTLGRTLIPFEQALQVSERRGDVTIVYSYRSWYPIHSQFINTQPPIVADARFRRALLQGLDRQQMADTFMGGLSSIAHAYVSPDTAEYKEIEPSIIRYEYDPRQATQAIEGLGYSRGPDGFVYDPANQKLSVQIYTTTRAEIHAKILFAIGDYWRQVGVEMEPVLVPPQRIGDREYRATFPAFEMILGANSVASRDIKRFHSSSTPLPENRFQVTGNNSRYRNAELDSFIEHYLTAIPRTERMEALGQIVHHQTDQLPSMGLFYDAEATLFTNRLDRVTGRGPNGSQAWNAYEWEPR
jgi:peptide/nickel transport system substrate-binding protein